MIVRGRDLVWRVRPSTWLLIATLAVSFVGVWALYPLTFPVRLNSGHDFRLLYAAAQSMRAHLNPYNAVTLLRQLAADGAPLAHFEDHGKLAQPYVYPPLFAWLLIPFTYLSLHWALLVWRMLSVVCVFVGTLGLISLWASAPGARFFASRANRVLLAALAATSPLALYAAYWGNPVVLVYGAMGGWVWALQRGHARSDVLAGVLMTVALLKPQLAFPLALIAVFCIVQGQDAWVRRRRAALGFGVALAALLMLDLLFTGPSLLLSWRQSVASLSDLIYHQPDMPSLAGLLQPTLLLHPMQQQQYSLIGISLLGAVAVIYLYWRLYRTWTPGALLALLTLVWCFASPYGHANDELFYVPGGIATISVLADMLGHAVGSTSYHELGLRLRQGALVSAQILVPVLALLVLWLGGAIQLRDGAHALQFTYRPGHVLRLRLAAAIVPMMILAAFITDWRFYRRRTDAGARDDKQSLTTGEEMLLTPVSQG